MIEIGSGPPRTGTDRAAGRGDGTAHGRLIDVSASTAELSPPATRSPVREHRGWWRQLGLDTGYVLLDLPVSLVAFALVVTALAVGLSTVVLWVGLPVLVLARGFATVERLRVPGVLRAEVPAPVYRRAPLEAALMRRLVHPLRDVRCWLDVGHAVGHLVVSIPAFAVVVTWPTAQLAPAGGCPGQRGGAPW